MGHRLYKDKLFGAWPEKHSIRKGPHPLLPEEEEQGLVFFPRDLVPVVHHPLIRGLGPAAERYLLIQAVHNYMYFTKELERMAVNPVTLSVAENDLGLDLPLRLMLDADKIYVDEAHHAQFSGQLCYDITATTGIERTAIGHPRFLRELQACLMALPSQHRLPAFAAFVIVSETLISSTLDTIPNDKQVVSAVREAAADHAVDEGRHHAFFSTLMEYTWPALSPEQRATIGPLLPQFIRWFLEPDKTAIRAGLSSLRLTNRQIDEILDWAYPVAGVTANIAHAARHTLNLFERAGVFADPNTDHAFFQSGLRS